MFTVSLSKGRRTRSFDQSNFVNVHLSRRSKGSCLGTYVFVPQEVFERNSMNAFANNEPQYGCLGTPSGDLQCMLMAYR